MVGDEDIKERLKAYFEELLNAGNEHGILDLALPIEGPHDNITSQDVQKAVQKMRSCPENEEQQSEWTSRSSDRNDEALEDEGIEWVWTLLRIC